MIFENPRILFILVVSLSKLFHLDEILQYSAVQYSIVQCSAVQYSTVPYSTVQYSTVQYSTVQYSTVQKRTVKCSTVIDFSIEISCFRILCYRSNRTLREAPARSMSLVASLALDNASIRSASDSEGLR